MNNETFDVLVIQQGSSGTFEVSDERSWYVLRETWQGARLLNTRIVGKHQTEHDAQRAKAETARALFAERETGR